MNLEKDLNEILRGLLKPKSRVKSRNELKEHISARPSDLVNVFTTSNIVSWKQLITSVIEHDLREIDSCLQKQQVSSFMGIQPFLSDILTFQFSSGNLSFIKISMNHITDQLLSKNESTLCFIGLEYLYILDSIIIDNHSIRCHLTQDKWNVIYNCVCSLLADCPSLLLVKVSGVFLKTIDFGYQHSTLPSYLVFNSIYIALCRFKDTHLSPFITIISAFNLAAGLIGANCRALVCRVGDKIIESMASYLTNGSFNVNTEHCCKFIIIQIEFHHPSDQIETEYVTENWINSVLRLHHLLLDKYQAQKDFFLKSISVSPSVLLENKEYDNVQNLFFSMLVQVVRCYQLITVYSPNSLARLIDSQPKKIKLSSNTFIEQIIDYLSNCYMPRVVINIHFLNYLLARLPRLFEGRIVSTVKLIFEIIHTSTTEDTLYYVINEVIHCLTHIVANTKLYEEQDVKNTLITNIILYNLQLQKQTSQYYKLLSLILVYDNQTKLPLFWENLLQNVCIAVDSNCIEFLWNYLSIRDLPFNEDITVNTVAIDEKLENSLPRHSHRISLINNILSCKKDNVKSYVNWLNSCDQLFMLGQVLAAQCMRSCKKSLLLTQKFFADSKLRKVGILNKEEEYNSNTSVKLMLEFDFLQIPFIPAPDSLTLYTSDTNLIVPKCNTEYMLYTLDSFSAVLTQLTANGHNVKVLSCALLSLLKLYFYFHLNLVVWSSFNSNTLVVTLQIEFISLVFNQCTKDSNQLSPNEVLASICKLNEFLFELRSIMTFCNHGQPYQAAVNSAITSLLNCIPNNLIDSIKCIVSTGVENSQTNKSLLQNVDPFISSDESRTVIITSVQLLCNLHWLYFELSTKTHNTTEDFLVNTLSSPIDLPLTQCILSLHANFAICEYFAGSSELICSETNLSLILDCLLNTCSQLCKFNQYALSKIMHILQSLASKIVKFIHVNPTISHHVENLIRILSLTYMNFRFSSPNRTRYIKLIFHIHGVFSDLDWPTFTIQTDNCEQSVQTTLKELIYQLNIDIERDCISCQAKFLALLHESSAKPIYSKLHFDSFRDMINAIWESDHSAFLSHNLIPSEFSDSVSTERIKTVLLFYVKMVAYSYSRSSLLVAQVLNFSVTKGINSDIIIRALTRITDNYCYQNLLAYFVANYESILIEWRCLNNSFCKFPFELFGLTELEFVENYATKCAHIILLTSDVDGMSFMVKTLPQIETDTDLIKLCFGHNLFILLLTTDEQVPIHGLNELSPNIHLTEARDYLMKHLSMELRRKLIQNSIESTILSLFTKYIGSCREERLQCIKGILPPVFIIDIDKSSLKDVFSEMFGIPLISYFKEKHFILPRLHTSLLKSLYASVQPNLFIFNLHCYLTFLQFTAMNACFNKKIFIFLLSDAVYVLLELLTKEGRINTDIHRLKNKFSDTLTNEDTCTLLQTIIGIYKLGIQCVPDLVRYSVSILNDVLCSHAQSPIPRISNLALSYLREFVVNSLFDSFHAKYVALLIFIPPVPVLEGVTNLLNVNLKSIQRIEILQELAVNTWYTHMSCVTYLNQVKLYLKLCQDIMADVDTCKLNSLLNKLVQKIQLVSTSSSTPKKLSELVYEIFSLLTPHYSQHKLSIGYRISPVYIKPFNLDANLYHFPILLSRLSQLIQSTDIQLKESAYNTFYSISDARSLLTIVSSLKQSNESSNIPIIFTSYLLKAKKVPKHTSPKLSNLPIPLKIPSENSLDLTIIWLRELCLFIISNYIKDPILLSTKIFIEISEICTRDFLKMYIYNVILEGEVGIISNISQHFNDGLKQAFDSLLTDSTETQVNEHSIRIIMEIVHFLRRRVLFVKEKRSFRDNFLLDINYLYLACSAFFCRDYHSTLLYLHIYTDPLYSKFSHQHSVPNDQVIPKLLINSYGKLGEIGCVNSVACDSLYLEFQKAKSIGNWPEVIQMCSTFPFNQVGGSQDLSEAIFQMGWYSMLLQQSNTISDIRFESAWRLGLWDDKLPDVDSDSCKEQFSQQIIYEGIQAFKERDISYASTCVKSCHTSTLEELLSSTEGSIIDIYNLLSNISISQTLIQFSSFAELVLTNKIQSSEFQSQTQMLPTKESLKDILSIRVSLLLRLVTFLETDRFTDPDTFVRLFELILNDVTTAAKLARKSNHCSDANNLLHTLELKLQTLDILPEEFRRKLLIQINLEFAKVKYLQKDFQTSFSLLESIKDNCNEFPELHCYLLTLYGNYLGEKQRETSSNVISQFLERSVNALRELGDDVSSTSQVKLLEKAHNSLAQYTDNQYNMIVEYLISPEYKLKVELAHALTHMSSLSLDNSTAITMDTQRNAKKHAEEYHKQSIEFEKDKMEFLKTSLKSYCFCLKLSNTNDMSISRVISLWFDNSDNHDISTMLAGHLSSISSHKFIPWVYQIIPRLCFIPSEVNNPFSETLRNLVFRMTTEHPYHCLPLLFAIFHSPLDAYFAPTHTYASIHLSRQFQNEDTNAQCKNILEATRSVLKDNIVDRMETIYIDLIDLAHHFNNDTCTMSLPKKCTLIKESNIRDLPIFSIDVPISPNADYTNVVRIVKFEPTCTFPGGITKPKLLTCLGSDGNRYKMLLKGREDLRKDAVIQQGFGLINQLLAQDAWFVEKGVRIRTYKIVPLSQSSGLINFCEGTMSLAEYLIHRKNGAHHRYYPNEPASENFEYEMKWARIESPQSSIQTYLLVCEQFHPVFRFFFLEMFNDASTWFQRRMQYTRSVAVASMAGYIFGIGDRHPENIRIDTSSAEIVHIDFGELFDSGKHLKVPEVVPFRLTRDMVDPMGDLGKEGVFRPCCEETLRIIRQSKENIKTILKVLLHTPLHKWKILHNCVKSSLNKQLVQDNDNMSPIGNRANLSIHGEDTNELALRVLLRINEKIDGIEGRTPLSIAGQVNRLIAEATDIVNLGAMYYGWKPWL